MRQRMIEIRYYGINDLTSYMFFKKSIEFIKNYKKNSIDQKNINFLLLVYNVLRNIDDKELHKAYSNLLCDKIEKAYTNDLKPDYFRIVNQITSKKIVEFRKSLGNGEIDIFGIGLMTM